MTVSGVPPPQEASALFSAVFASRVLDIRFSQRLHQEEQLEVSLAHFDRIEGRFQEAAVTVRLDRRGVEGIDPPLISPREFQQALKQFYTERFSGEQPKAASSAGEVPRQVLESLLRGMEGHLGGRSEDVQASWRAEVQGHRPAAGPEGTPE